MERQWDDINYAIIIRSKCHAHVKMGCIINLISYLFALELADEDLGDEDVLALESISEISKISEEGGEGEANLQITLIITLKDAMLSLSRVFKIIEVRTNIKNYS